MFILERLIGVGIYALLLGLVCLSVVGKSHKKIKRILFLYTVTLSVLAFFYVPYETADLYRIYDFVRMFSDYSFGEVLEHQAQRGEWGIGNILYWAIGKTGIPQLLPALVTFACYSCVFYIINKTAEKRNVSGKNVAIALFFYMSTGTYIFVISGIRCMLGISILAFCFFRESAEGKFNIFHIPLYFVAVLIHSFVAVLTVLRLVLPVFNRKTPFIRRTIYLFVLGLGTALIYRYMEGYVLQIFEKAEGYIGGDMYSYVWDYAIAIFVLALLGSIIVKGREIKHTGVLRCDILRAYIFVCMIGAIFLCYEFSIFHRTIVYVLPILSIPILMSLLQKKDEESHFFTKHVMALIDRPLTYDVMVVLVSAGILFLSCARGSLCSLKFFVL